MANNINDYAIVVGIDTYAQLRPLQSAVRDASMFAEWLVSPEGGGLSQANVRLIVSPPEVPSNPFDARPGQTDIDRALYEIVGHGGTRIGRRLYFYFAGHGIGPNFDDVGMLMANASMKRLDSNVGLSPYRRFFRESGLFDEVVFILDCSRDPYLRGQTSAPALDVSRNKSARGVKDFVVLAAAHGGKAFNFASTGTGEPRGVLTQAVLDGLRGGAIDPFGRITSSSLSSYVRRRVPELTPKPGQEPEIILPDNSEEIVFNELPADEVKGTLIVELPHWTAEIEIRNQFQMIPYVGPVKQGSEPGLYVSETKLPPGIYQAEVTLEGKSEQQLIPVVPNQTNTISRHTWKGLKPTSAAPLSGAATTDMIYTQAARKWSLKATWEAGAKSGESGLFLFMSATDREEHKKFAASLLLLDGEGNLVTDFAGDAVEKDYEAGWLAFNANLKPGYYVLRRGRHYRVRHQSVFLCRGWQTQVFLKTRRRPSLRLMTLNMARPGYGFVPEDETTVAAEAVLDIMRYGRKSNQFLKSEKMSALLRGKFQNPWLGILAAYALNAPGRDSRNEQAHDNSPGIYPTGSRGKEHEEIEALFGEVMNFLSAEISDHPDVRALRLKSEAEAERFPHPPLLRVGLKLVQRHAMNFTETIPLNSLTDLVLDNLLLNSPWTAWRELVAAASDPSFSSPFTEDALLAATTKSGRVRHRPPSIKQGVSAQALLQSETARAPVFSLSPDDDEATDAAQRTFAAETNAQATSAVALYEVALIQEAQKLTQSVDADSSKERHGLDFKKLLNDLLASVKPKDISDLSGMPLSRTTEGLERLRRCGDIAPTLDGTGDIPEELFTPEAQEVFRYALRHSAQQRNDEDQYQQLSVESPASDAPPLDLAPAATSVTIEDIVLKLRAEANRLVEVEGDKSQAQELANCLRSVSDKLLRQADFIVLTSSQGSMLRGNGAFLALISPAASDSSGDGDDSEGKKIRRKNYRAWESLLAGAPTGRTVTAAPVPNSISADWELRRIAIEDNLRKTTQAYLNLLRCRNSPRLAESTLLALDAVMPELALEASFFAHGDAKRRKAYAESLVALARKLEDIVLSGGTVAGSADDHRSAQHLADDITKGNIMSRKDDVQEGGAGQSLVDDPELKMPDATMYESEFWGIARHELIAGAAEEKLSSEKAKKAVRRILAPLGGMMLSDVAGWADNVKRRRPNPDTDDAETVAFLEDERNRSNHTWHYVNLPLDADGYSREAYPDFTGDEDVVQIMSECIRVLQGRSNRFSELNALRLLAHMAGDIHQPAHVGCCYIDESSTPAKLVRDPQVAAQKQLESDQGGNRVLLPLGSSGVSLHSYWDSRLGGTIKPEDFLDAEDAPADAPPEAPAGDAPAIDPQLRQKFIGKLAAMIGDSPAAGDAPAEADAVPPELWPEQWASESLVTARAAYKSLKIAEARGNKFIVSWEGKEAYEARCKPLVIRQMKLAAQNLAALLDEVLG